MPRVAIKKKDYMKKDLTACIVGKMYGNYTQASLAKEFGVTQAGMGYKIRECLFAYDELLTLFKVLQFSDDEILHFLKL